MSFKAYAKLIFKAHRVGLFLGVMESTLKLNRKIYSDNLIHKVTIQILLKVVPILQVLIYFKSDCIVLKLEINNMSSFANFMKMVNPINHPQSKLHMLIEYLPNGNQTGLLSL